MKAFPWTRSACATRTLTSRCFADWSYEQRLHADSRIVDFLLAESWIDHIHNPVDCDRSLRDIRRNHHFPASFRSGLKHKLLLLGRKRGEERQDLEREKNREQPIRSDSACLSGNWPALLLNDRKCP